MKGDDHPLILGSSKEEAKEICKTCELPALLAQEHCQHLNINHQYQCMGSKKRYLIFRCSLSRSGCIARSVEEMEKICGSCEHYVSGGKEILIQQVGKSSFVDNIFEQTSEVNEIFNERHGFQLFRTPDPKLVLSIQRECSNEDEFNNRIQALRAYLDCIDTKKLKEILDLRGDKKSIGCLEVYLKKFHSEYDKEIISNLRVLNTLRSKRIPAHPKEHRRRIKRELTQLGYGRAEVIYDNSLWELILETFLDSMIKLKNALMQ